MMRKYLKDIRKKAGLSQVQIAKKLGMAQTNYSAIESGKTKTMTAQVMKQIANICGVKVNHIMNEELRYGLNRG